MLLTPKAWFTKAELETIDVNVAKAEKRTKMNIWLNPKCSQTMDV